MMNKKYGFTLAEVLITLGIIGVVAAMTIPTLISNTNSAKFKSQFKKSISSLNQAGLMGQAQFDLDYNVLNANCTGANDSPIVGGAGSHTSICALFNGALTGHRLSAEAPTNNQGIQYNISTGITAQTSTATGATWAVSTNPYYLTMADGSMVVFSGNMQHCTREIGASNVTGTQCQGFIDVNGPTLPNREVICQSSGSTAISLTDTCVVPNDAQHVGDIYPVVFHDATVEALTNAGRSILNAGK